MSKLKVAVLEDNQDLLNDLIRDLTETGLVEVVMYATNSSDFLEKMKTSPVEALILDIELNNDSMNGIDVANHLKLPVLFTSGKTRDYLSEKEDIKINLSTPVEDIMKPISQHKLKTILPKFIAQIKLYNKTNHIMLDFKDNKNQKIPIDDIVYVETNPETGSNNKRIYFTNRNPEVLSRTSFEELKALGLTPEHFARPSQSHRVNKKYVDCYKKEDKALEIKWKDESTLIKVSENYRSEMKRMFL